MKTPMVVLLLLATPAALAGGPGAPQSPLPVGVVSKVILDVTRHSLGQEWMKAARGDALLPGDLVRTGDRSFAVLKFNDNSMVRIRENSEVELSATQRDRLLSKSVDVGRGSVGFRVSAQKPGEEFRFTSPTSVASVRGTEGLFTAAPDADTLVVTHGLVRLASRFGSQTVDVGEGFTGIARRDGGLAMRQATRNEQRAAEEAAKSGDQPHKLKIRLRNAQGEERDLIIDYKD